MSKQVHMGATLQCTFGVAPSTLVVTPENKTLTEFTPAATIMDHVPVKNIPPFAMCTTPSNPAVAAATAAAMGVLTPVPCMPVTPAPWVPGAAQVLINNLPALDQTSTCNCVWGGVISITNPGCTKTDIP